MSKIFYSKILLFGEYTLMFGSQALSIPFHDFYGKFSLGKKEKTKKGFDTEKHLRTFLEYLKNLDTERKEIIKIDTARFESDLNNGLTVESNIPVGYGMGSSGALVAAVFDRYGTNSPIADTSDYDLTELKKIFSVMESFFHGKSSGFDPLVCYLNAPVFIDEKGKAKQLSLNMTDDNKKGTVFLLDSKITGETRPLVEWFVNKFNDNEIFRKKITNQLIPLNKRAINSFVSAGFDELSKTFHDISLFTYKELKPMIPSALTDVWKHGLESGDYMLKLCGSGGGGMMLGYTHDFDKAGLLLNNYTLYKVL